MRLARLAAATPLMFNAHWPTVDRALFSTRRSMPPVAWTPVLALTMRLFCTRTLVALMTDRATVLGVVPAAGPPTWRPWMVTFEPLVTLRAVPPARVTVTSGVPA